MIRDRVQRLAVRRELDLVDGAVPVLRQRAALAGLEIQHHDVEAIGLEAGALHRAPREHAAVGREHGLRIPRRVVRREVARLAAGDADLVEIEVRRPRLRLALHARVEHELAAVRRERVLAGVAERFRGHICIERRGQRDRLDGAAILDLEYEQLRDAAVVPRIPVPHERAVVDASARLRLCRLLDATAAAREVFAAGEDVHRNGESRTVGRESERADVERQIRYLLCFAADGRQPPHLRRAAAPGDEVDVATVARPFGRVVVFRMCREPARLRALGRNIERPQILTPAVRGHVRLAEHEHECLAVG